MNFQNTPLSVTYHQGSRITLTPKWHDRNIICPNSKIYYVIDGEVCVETEKEKLLARAGDAILIPAGIKHSYHLSELGHAQKYWFHFDLRSGQGNFFDLLNLPYMKHIGLDSSICNLFNTIVNSENRTPKSRLSLSAAILTLISIFVEDSDYIEQKEKNSDETDKVISYIRKSYHENFTLEALAHMANLTPNYFAKKFKERIGIPPLKYINALRIERAKFLLEHTTKPINTIMEEVGFWDSAHFSKLFKLSTGYSPTKFRKALVS